MCAYGIVVINKMNTAEKIRHLKLIIDTVDVTQPRPSWFYRDQLTENPSVAIPKGAVVEILGNKKYEWFIQFLIQNPEIKTFWAEKEQQVLPTALQQRGLNLDRITFGIFGEDSYLSLRKVIQSQVFDVIISPNLFQELKLLRAFQLMTEKSNNTLFLVGQKTASTAWPISLQLDISKKGKGIDVEILKQRYGVQP